MKTCYSCGIQKDYSEFHKDNSRKDGCQRACKPCVKAMDAKRRVENKDKLNEQYKRWTEANKEYVIERSRKYREENSERMKEYRAKYYAENRERLLAINQKYREENQEKEKARNSRWSTANPEICRAKANRRRAVKLGAGGDHTKNDILRLFYLQHGKCACCSKKLKKSGEDKYHIDHVHPLSKGGSNGPENLQLLCKKCNLKKGSKDPLDWAKENGRLF